MNRAGIINRLAKLGVRNAADALREEVRLRHLAAGRDRESALALAWQEMWETFKPIAERLEGQASGESPLQGCTDDLAPLLDTSYQETDPGKRLRDGLLWTAEEIRRVVRDTDEGPTVDLSRAATPPPTVWAVFCLEFYAHKPPASRGELIARVLPFATKIHDPRETSPDDAGGGFLDEV